MTSGRILVRGAFLSGAGMLFSMAGSLGAAVIFGRVLPESEVGTYWLLILAGDGMLLLTSFGLHATLPKIIASAPVEEQAPRGASIALVQLLVSSAFGIALLASWALLRSPGAVSTNENWLKLFPFLWALPLLFIIATQRDTALATMAGLNRFGPRAAALVLGALANVTLVAIFIWWLKGGLLSLLLCTLASYSASAAWLAFNVMRGAPVQLRLQPYAEALRFSLPLYLNNIMTFIFQRLDTFLVAALLGNPFMVAYYEMGKRLPNIFARVLSAALVPYLPGISTRLVAGDDSGAARLLNKTVSLVAFLGYASVLFILIIQRPLITALFSEKYLPSLSVLWLLMTGTCLSLQAGVLGQSLIAAGRPALVTWANGSAAILSVALNLSLIPRFGITGAGVAFVATALASAAIQGWLMSRYDVHVSFYRLTVPQFILALCLGTSQLSSTVFGRISAFLLFGGLCLATSVVSIKQLQQLAQMLLPGQHPQRVRGE